MRRVRLVLMLGAIVGLIPWMIYLAITLPDKCIAHNWPATGGICHVRGRVGFDILFVLFIAATALPGLLRRQLLVLSPLASGWYATRGST